MIDIKSIIKNQKLNELIRFVFVGILATIIHYCIYLLLINVFWVNVAYSLGYLISFILNFFITSYFTFHSKPNLKKGIGFGVSHLINYGLHLVLLNFFLWLGFSTVYAPIPVFMIVIPINFILVRTVFKSKKFQ